MEPVRKLVAAEVAPAPAQEGYGRCYRLVRKRGLRSPVARLTLLALTVVGFSLGYLILEARQIELAYRLEAARQQLEGLRLENRRLAGAVLAAQNLAVVEHLARTRLGMVDGGAVEVLRVAAPPSPPAAGRSAPALQGEDGHGEGPSVAARLERWLDRVLPLMAQAYAERLAR